MPKRSSKEKIEYHQAKIRKLEEKQRRPRRRVVIYSDSSESQENSDNDIQNPVEPVTDAIANSVPVTTSSAEEVPAGTPCDIDPLVTDVDPSPAPTQDASATEESVPELDADLLSALGDTADEVPTYGEKIHPDLAQRWQPILRRGLLKEPKEKLLKEYAIPENCKLLRAPSLNPEISAAVTDGTRLRDKKLEVDQQQLGLGITAVNKAMSVLLTGEDKQSRVQAIKMLSDGCRILSDLHYLETRSRIKLVTPNLDKAFLNIIKDVERDEFVFGKKISEKIKASKTIEKQGLQIKKTVTAQKTPTPASQTTAHSRYQGNWTTPSRSHQPSNRGGRGGAQRNPPPTSSHKTTPASSAQAKTSSQTKQRAPPRQ